MKEKRWLTFLSNETTSKISNFILPEVMFHQDKTIKQQQNMLLFRIRQMTNMALNKRYAGVYSIIFFLYGSLSQIVFTYIVNL